MNHNEPINPRINYSRQANITINSMDDGKANAISGPWYVEMNHCLERDDMDAVILMGVERDCFFHGRLSAGFV